MYSRKQIHWMEYFTYVFLRIWCRNTICYIIHYHGWFPIAEKRSYRKQCLSFLDVLRNAYFFDHEIILSRGHSINSVNHCRRHLTSINSNHFGIQKVWKHTQLHHFITLSSPRNWKVSKWFGIISKTFGIIYNTFLCRTLMTK